MQRRSLMRKRTETPYFLFVCSFALLASFSVSLFGQTQVASLRSEQPLHWQRTSPTAQQPDGPLLYQLVFTPGTPGTIAKFDNNPRHLINSHITDNGGAVARGGLSINARTCIVPCAGRTQLPCRATTMRTFLRLDHGRM